MSLDPRTKLLILAITSISVFLNGSIFIECLFTLIPFLLLLREKKFTVFKSAVIFVVLLAIQILVVPKLPTTSGGIVYMFSVYIRKLLPCFMLGSFLIKTTKVSTFLIYGKYATQKYNTQNTTAPLLFLNGFGISVCMSARRLQF